MKQVPYSDLTSYYVERADRRVVDLRTFGIEEGVALGRSVYRRAYPPLPEHRHFGVAELAFLETGLQPYRVGNRRFTLAGGEGLLIPPDMPHSSDGQPSYPGKRFWLQFRLPRKGSARWMGLTSAETAPLIALLRAPLKVSTAWPADFVKRIHALFRLIDRPASPARTAMLRVALLALLFELLDLNSPAPSRGNPARVKKAADWAEARLAEPLTIGQLAAQAGLSVSSFKHVFREHMGITPHAYLLRKRIDRARQLLGAGQGTVTEIAFACGFSSSQYFATAFKRIVGITPNDMLTKRAVPLPSGADGQ
ncbi:MAG: AraC family transcriptional regulator [Kiritimatiellia bacterium]|nr:AraC family transcriptional regulator [Kiritimatiellia bacterium]